MKVSVLIFQLGALKNWTPSPSIRSMSKRKLFPLGWIFEQHLRILLDWYHV
jgi:hypothetical protein